MFCFIWGSALDSSDLLLSYYHLTSLASPMTIILISTLKHINIFILLQKEAVVAGELLLRQATRKTYNQVVARVKGVVPSVPPLLKAFLPFSGQSSGGSGLFPQQLQVCTDL